MKTSTTTIALLSFCGLALLPPATGFGDGTNAPLKLFGITVAKALPEDEAQYDKGYAYFSGENGEPDYTNAAACFQKAAELGHAEAQFNLGICLMNGLGVEQNDTMALAWFKKALDQGVVEACYPTGVCCYNLKEYAEAYAWALQAEAQGDDRLKNFLGGQLTAEQMAQGTERFRKMPKMKAEPRQ